MTDRKEHFVTDRKEHFMTDRKEHFVTDGKDHIGDWKILTHCRGVHANKSVSVNIV